MCSGAAVPASKLVSESGGVLISPSNTSPSLTSDLVGNAGDDYNVGYYRTAHNDLFQGAAVADFVFNELGFTTAAAIHDGDPYTNGLASAFRNAYEELGGEVVVFTAVAKEDTDMTGVLTEVAAASPQALFFPLFPPAAVADFVFNELGFTTAAVIHDGDPYTDGLATAFRNAYEDLGGEVVVYTAVAKDDTDMTGVLT